MSFFVVSAGDLLFTTWWGNWLLYLLAFCVMVALVLGIASGAILVYEEIIQPWSRA